jgi:hypothetical protein
MVPTTARPNLLKEAKEMKREAFNEAGEMSDWLK